MNKYIKAKGIKSIIKKFMIIISIFIFNILIIMNTSYAISKGQSISLLCYGNCGDLLKYKGEIVEINYVRYEAKLANYPAYCLDETKPGVTKDFGYDVKVNGQIKDNVLWRYFINGYPLKKYSELGCASIQEAYAATQQAIYCYIHNRNIEDYEAIGEAGQRVLNAMKLIIENAKNSQETMLSNAINIKPLNKYFEEDSIDSNYVSKTYEFEAEAETDEIYLSLQKIDEEYSIVEGVKLTDIDNNDKNVFNKNEKFKVLISKEVYNEDLDFRIAASTKIYTKPVYDSNPENPVYQDYAIVKSSYEDTYVSLIEKYEEEPEQPEEPKEPEEPKKPEQKPQTVTPKEEVKKLPVTGM